MPKRIRILACSFALGVGMLLLGATAAHATPQSGAHVSAVVGQPGGSYSPSPYGKCHCHTPTPAPTSTCQCHTPTPTPTPPTPSPTCTCMSTPPTSPPPTTPTSPPSTTPAPVPTTVSPTAPPTQLVSASATATGVPTGGANTGGGGSIGGGGPNVPLVAGGAALALCSAGLGLAAYRRYRKSAA